MKNNIHTNLIHIFLFVQGQKSLETFKMLDLKYLLKHLNLLQ